MITAVPHILSILLILSVQGYGQHLLQHLESLSIDPKSCDHYHGYMDDRFALNAYLCDSAGAYQIESSKEIYTLDIEHIGTTLELTEWDEREQQSAIITLANSDGGYAGEWYHATLPSKYSFVLSSTPQEIDSKILLATYSSIIEDEVVSIHLNHTTMQITLSQKYNDGKIYTSTFTCDDTDCRKMIADVTGFDSFDSITIRKLNNGNYKLTTFLDGDRKKTIKLFPEELIYSASKNYMDYRSMLSAEYPNFKHKALNKYLMSLQIDWIKKTSQYLRALYQHDDAVITDDRLRNQAFSWIEIEMWSDRFISGVRYIQTTWNEKVDAEAFHYLIDKEQEVELSEIWTSELQSKESQEIAEKAGTWLVGLDGIYHIYFDRVRGVQRSKLPADDVKSRLRDDNWLQSLVNDHIIRL